MYHPSSVEIIRNRVQDRGCNSTCRTHERNSRKILKSRSTVKDGEESFEKDGLVDRLAPSILSPCRNMILNPAEDKRKGASSLGRDARLISMPMKQRVVSKQFPTLLLMQLVLQIAPTFCPHPSKLSPDGMHELRPRMPGDSCVGSMGVSLHAALWKE